MPKRKAAKDQPNGKKKESAREIYARIRREFSAADLQRYTEIEEGVPLRDVLAQMEALDEKMARKRKQAQ